jgi:hypothetical protein
MARAKWPGAYLKDITKWWDHYNDQPAIIIEDLDPDHKYLARQLKIWSDRYPFSPEHKGSYLPPIRPKHVIVTSQYAPEEIFTHEDSQAIRRRFTVTNLSGDLQGP